MPEVSEIEIIRHLRAFRRGINSHRSRHVSLARDDEVQNPRVNEAVCSGRGNCECHLTSRKDFARGPANLKTLSECLIE